MATALQVLTKIDFPALVSTAATIVGLVETIFSGKKGIGPKKRERAIKAITRVLEVDGDVSPAVLTVISFLVDVLGKNAGKVEVTEDILQIWTAVQTFVEATDGIVNGTDVDREVAVDLINGAVDIPGLSEYLEAWLIRTLFDVAVDRLREKQHLEAGPQSGKSASLRGAQDLNMKPGLHKF